MAGWRTQSNFLTFLAENTHDARCTMHDVKPLLHHLQSI